MNTEALFLFLILLLGLVLCSFLGGNVNKESFEVTTTNKTNQNMNVDDSDSDSDDDDKNDQKYKTNYDNYNHYSGSFTQLTNGETFYGKNGGTIKVIVEKNGSSGLKVKLSQNEDPIYFTSNPMYSNNNVKQSFTIKSENLKYYGPYGEKAKVININGENYIKVITENGSYFFSINKPNYNTYNNNPSTYFGSTGVNGGNLNNSNKAYSGLSQSISSYDYSKSLPQGVPKGQIPPGQEDLYILKSEVVPPVCPACPAAAAVCPRQEPCPPCPACARCPEPSFECKKVPNYGVLNNQSLSGSNYNSINNQSLSGSNYNSVNNQFLPVPVLSDFSSFGM